MVLGRVVRLLMAKISITPTLNRWSQMTFLILLSEDFEGGETQFWVNKDNPTKPAKTAENATLINVRTPAGSVLCFPHGMHPLHCLHSSEKITQGNQIYHPNRHVVSYKLMVNTL